MLKSILINLMFFTWPFYYIIEGSSWDRVEVILKVYLVIIIIVVLDNGFYNLKRLKG